MAEALELKAWTRARTGKGGARASRREGRIPGILYGDKATPLTIDVDYKAINTQLHTGHFQSTIFMLDLDGAKTRVIPRQVQLDPIRDFPIHVDFMRVGEHSLVTVEVPVRFLNEAASPGIKRGGILNVVRHEIQVRCPADAIPEHFDVDLTGLEIGDSVHISAITLPEGVKPTTTERDFTVATIVGRCRRGSRAWRCRRRCRRTWRGGSCRSGRGCSRERKGEGDEEEEGLVSFAFLQPSVLSVGMKR